MKNLLYKELRLSLHPSAYFFLLFGLLLLIPSWPYFIAFMYLFIAVMNTFLEGKANQDIFFTVSMPVRKTDAVRARIYTISVFEILQLGVAIPFAILNTRINPFGNGAGMNPNIAFFGLVLMMYGVFNLAFFPLYYKTAYKVGAPLIVGTVSAILFAGVVEVLVHTVPFFVERLNPVGAGHLTYQLGALVLGLLVFVGLTGLSCRSSSKRFAKVDL